MKKDHSTMPGIMEDHGVVILCVDVHSDVLDGEQLWKRIQQSKPILHGRVDDGTHDSHRGLSHEIHVPGSETELAHPGH